MFDLSFLLQEPVLSIAGSSITTAAINFLGYYYGEFLQFSKFKQELVAEKLRNPEGNIPASIIAKCKNLYEIAQIADNLGGFSKDKSVEFSSEWFERFFDAASMASDEDMQTIWAKILSGEAEESGKYSFRFIESMRLLSKSEAEVFLKLSRLVLKEVDGSLYLFTADNVEQTELYESFGIGDSELILSQECGLINMGVPTSNEIRLRKEEFNGFYNDQIFIHFYSEENSPKELLHFSSYTLTRFGRKLYELIEEETNEQFIIQLAESIRLSVKDLGVSAYQRLSLDDEDGELDLDLKKDLLA